MARNGQLNKTLRVRVSEETLAELVARTELSNTYRSVGSFVRAAIRSYLAKGKR